MDLDEVDRKLLQAVLEDADRSLRELASTAGVSAPTVSSRLDRLEDLGLIGPTRREVDLARLGTLVLVDAPPEDLEDLADHDRVFQVHRTQQNRAIAWALVPGPEDVAALHQAFPRAQTQVLLHRHLSRAPRLPHGSVQVPCSQCGKPVEGEGNWLTLGGKRYVACCPSCQARLEERFQRHEGSL